MGITVKHSRAMAYVGNLFRDSQAEFRSSIAADLGKEINDVIESGTSPVAGQGRFADYSDGYKKTIDRGKAKGTDGQIHTDKKKRPVNLHVSGDMLDSQKVKITDRGVNVSYSSKFVKFHNETGRVLRRMLPTKNGEEFSRVITKFLRERAALAVGKFLKK